MGAHPRSRGEHEGGDLPNAYGLGSSPLARGTPSSIINPFKWCGLIPARAGNTRGKCYQSPRRRAHPRSRGEHFRSLNRRARRLGSSPLARGTPSTIARQRPLSGLIPARAGNTDNLALFARRHRAHPRSRGEHSAAEGVARGGAGSSPLARGTHEKHYATPVLLGLIPARAGNTGNGCRGNRH